MQRQKGQTATHAPNCHSLERVLLLPGVSSKTLAQTNLEPFSTGWTFLHRQHTVAVLIRVIRLVFVSSAIAQGPRAKATTYRRLVHGCDDGPQREALPWAGRRPKPRPALSRQVLPTHDTATSVIPVLQMRKPRYRGSK